MSTTPTVALLDSLIAQYRRCAGSSNGDRTHSRRCKRCARGATVARNRERGDALA